MTTRILVIAEFDPCGVCLSHRDAVRAWCDAHPGHDIDIRVALNVAATPRQRDADWVFLEFQGVAADTHEFSYGKPCPEEKIESIIDFARKADILQVCPGIGSPWASDPGSAHAPGMPGDFPKVNYFDRGVWEEIVTQAKVKVAYIHGSRNAWAHRREYAAFYGKDHRLATSTLDYTFEMSAAYLPPAPGVEITNGVPAIALGSQSELRSDDDPLIVAHTPTDPANCSTEFFMKACRELGINVSYMPGYGDHEECLAVKRGAFAGFDHLRGSFSVNHLENCMLGLASLVGLKPEYALCLAVNGFGVMPSLGVVDQASLYRALKALRDSPSLTREHQNACFTWAWNNYSMARIGERMADFYTMLLKERG